MSRVQVIGAVLLALLLVMSNGAVAVGSGGAPSVDAQTATDASAADEVFVAENGDVVLVSETEQGTNAPAAGSEFDTAAGEQLDVAGDFGFDVESGLVHLFFEGDFADSVEDGDELETTGDASIEVTPDSIAGSADITAAQPEEIEDLSVDVDHEQTRSSYDSSSSVSLAVAEEEASDASVSFESESTVSASSFESTGSMTADEPTGADGSQESQDELYDLSLSEDDGTYTLDVTEERPVMDTQWERENWETEDAALETLEGQFNAMAVQLGGTAAVDLQTHEFEEGDESHDLTLEYEVTFENVKDQVAEMLASQLENDQELDLSEAEAQSIADSISALEIDSLDLTAETSGGEQTVEWDVAIDNYDELVLGLFEISESIPDIDDEMAEQLDESRELLEAQDAADLTQTSSIDFSMETEDGLTSLEFESESEAENWGDYVDEVEDRGLGEYLVESSYEVEADADDEEIDTEFAFDVVQEGALDAAIEDAITAAEEDPATDEETLDALESVRDVEFESAKANATLTDTTVSGMTAAQFGNLTAPEVDGLEITGVHGESDGNTSTVYVSVANYVSEDPTESEVREQDEVNEDTVVHMPGEWDGEDLPQTDVESLTQYLEESNDDDESSDLPLGSPAVGIVAALLALAIAGGAAHRRTER